MNSEKQYNHLVFIISATSTISVSFLGLVTISELIMIAILPWLIIKDKKHITAFTINFRETALMILLWLASVIISDIYNGTVLAKFYKGIGHPIMIFFSFLGLSLLLKKANYFFKYFIAGNIIASIINLFTNIDASLHFRFGFLKIIIAIAFWFIYSLWSSRRKNVALYLLILLALLGFMTGGRSNGLILLITFATLYYINNSRIKNTNISGLKTVKLLGLMVLVVLIVQEIYVFSVNSKVFPSEYQEKFELQLASGLPVILSGRSELLGSSQAIMDSPIFGHGSWASNPKYLALVLNAIGVDDDGKREYLLDTLGNSKIPSHSLIFGEWVEHGILGMFFFLFFGRRLLNLLSYILSNREKPEIPFLIYILINYVWHLFFSPLGAEKRLFVSLILTLNAAYIYSKNMRRKNENYESSNLDKRSSQSLVT